MKKPLYDLFLHYDRKDADQVRRLATKLSDAGLQVWLDEWELVPGASWRSAVEQALAGFAAVGFCFGSAPPGGETSRLLETRPIEEDLQGLLSNLAKKRPNNTNNSGGFPPSSPEKASSLTNFICW